jgi:lysophospholipase L1-like esterase
MPETLATLMFGIVWVRRVLKAIGAIAFILAILVSPSAHAETAASVCDLPSQVVRLAYGLPRFAHKLSTKEPITIVAIGSSSTAGVGASSIAASYPSRLELDLRKHFPDRLITVLNRGVNGEEVAEMLKRFNTGVVAAKPDLVLWQIGTNSIFHQQPISDNGTAIRNGLRIIRSTGSDVILINPQFAPKVVEKPQVENVLATISMVAKQDDVDLFHRFEIMQRWHDFDKMPFEIFVSADGLHMNDWGYDCLAKGLSLAIIDAAQ